MTVTPVSVTQQADSASSSPITSWVFGIEVQRTPQPVRCVCQVHQARRKMCPFFDGRVQRRFVSADNAIDEILKVRFARSPRSRGACWLLIPAQPHGHKSAAVFHRLFDRLSLRTVKGYCRPVIMRAGGRPELRLGRRVLFLSGGSERRHANLGPHGLTIQWRTSKG